MARQLIQNQKCVGSTPIRATNMADKCELCGSTIDELNFHHLIPRTLHSNKWFEKRYTKDFMRNHGIMICKYICHGQIHRFISEKQMGTTYNTLDKLLEHPDVINFIEWRKKRI